MSNNLRWVCICAVVAAALGSSRPLLGLEFEHWQWHEGFDDSDSDYQLERYVWWLRHCTCGSCEWYEDGLYALAQVDQASSSNIGDWGASVNESRGGDCIEPPEPPFDGVHGQWYADMWVEAECSDSAEVCGYAQVYVDIVEDGATVAWEWCYIWVTQVDGGTPSTHITHKASWGPGDGTLYEEDGTGSNSEWYVIDSGLWNLGPLGGVHWYGSVVGVCHINDQYATGYGYADIIDCYASVFSYH